MVRPWSCRVIYYFDTPALGRRHQSFGRVRDLEEYIQDFDILLNKAEVNEKQALVIFLGGIDLEIKNTVKIFEPKTLKHAYNLAWLQANTLTHRKSPSYISKVASIYTNPTVSNPPNYPIQTTKNPVNSQTNMSKPQPASWTANSNHSNYSNPSRPTKFIKNQEFEDRRLKVEGSVLLVWRQVCTRT